MWQWCQWPKQWSPAVDYMTMIYPSQVKGSWICILKLNSGDFQYNSSHRLVPSLPIPGNWTIQRLKNTEYRGVLESKWRHTKTSSSTSSRLIIQRFPALLEFFRARIILMGHTFGGGQMVHGLHPGMECNGIQVYIICTDYVFFNSCFLRQ